jgi:hypothetical protein
LKLEGTVLRFDNCSGYFHTAPFDRGRPCRAGTWALYKVGARIRPRPARKSCTPGIPAVHASR